MDGMHQAVSHPCAMVRTFVKVSNQFDPFDKCLSVKPAKFGSDNNLFYNTLIFFLNFIKIHPHNSKPDI